jgi:hypothetical protein
VISLARAWACHEGGKEHEGCSTGKVSGLVFFAHLAAQRALDVLLRLNRSAPDLGFLNTPLQQAAGILLP